MSFLPGDARVRAEHPNPFRQPGVLVRLAPFVLLTLAGASQSPAQSPEEIPWELSPYRVQLLTAVADAPSLGAPAAEAFRRSLTGRLQAETSGRWRLESAAVSPELRQRVLHKLSRWQEAPTDSSSADKLLYLAITPTASGYLITAREFDRTAGLWNAAVVRRADSTPELVEQALLAALDAFAPVAQVDLEEKGVVTLRMRAGGIPPPARGVELLGRTSTFRPVLLECDASGSPKAASALPIPWTYLTTSAPLDARPAGGAFNPARARFKCRLQTSLTEPVLPAYHPLRRCFAVGVALPSQPTRLRIQTTGESPQPLSGCEVCLEPPLGTGAKPVKAGLTNQSGELELSPGGLQWLTILRGGELLTRRPIIPGLEHELLLELPSDPGGLELAAALSAWKDDAVDLAARQIVLRDQIRAAIGKGDSATVRVLVKVMQSADSASLSSRLTELRAAARKAGEAFEKRLEPHFVEAEQLLEKLPLPPGKSVDSILQTP